MHIIFLKFNKNKTPLGATKPCITLIQRKSAIGQSQTLEVRAGVANGVPYSLVKCHHAVRCGLSDKGGGGRHTSSYAIPCPNYISLV